jgi:tetratricopeptide (TPR) repeat protein
MLDDGFRKAQPILRRLRGGALRVVCGRLVLLLPILLLLPSCRSAALEKQAQLIKQQDAEIARQRREIEALQASQQTQKKRLTDCNRAFRDYFEPAQSSADRERAVALYREGIALCPDDDVAHYELGNLLAAQGHNREAEMEFERAVEINPAFSEAKARLEALRKQP